MAVETILKQHGQCLEENTTRKRKKRKVLKITTMQKKNLVAIMDDDNFYYATKDQKIRDSFFTLFPIFYSTLSCTYVCVCVYIWIHTHTHTCIYVYEVLKKEEIELDDVEKESRDNSKMIRLVKLRNICDIS